MKLKLNKVDVPKQRLKAILFFAFSAAFFVGLVIIGKKPVSVLLAIGCLICVMEGISALFMLLLGIFQKRRISCEEKEPSLPPW